MTKILWIDLEMTGLNPDKEVIIEAAAIITKGVPPFELIDQYHCVIRQPQEYLDNMDEWNSKTHKSSGLYYSVPSGKPAEEAEQELVDLVDEHFEDEPAIIAGNSISQDRLFIKKYFKVLESKLHYRMLDVTAWRLLFDHHKIHFKKISRHRALEDIESSIEEMNFYYSFINQEKIEETKKELKNHS